MDFQSAESGQLPINEGRLIKTLADSTVRGVMDAVVELVTNSDDSYARQEQEGINSSGRIDIHISRGVGGHCRELKIIDEAGGMDFQSLRRAIEFSGETSGFKEGKSVRGFFGRGLKESIIALGIGTIFTLKRGVLSRALIQYDEKNKQSRYDLSIPIQNLSQEELANYGFLSNSGTAVTIQVTNAKKDHILGRNHIEGHVMKHYSLREINSSPKRTVYLHFSDVESKEKYKSNVPMAYKKPNGNIVFDEDRKIQDSVVHFKIFESLEQLDTPKTSTGEAGLLIKTEGAVLDNQLFGFETDPNGLYYFGEIVAPGIAQAIRSGDESIVDTNRAGLAWNHPYNKALEILGKEILGKLIAERKERLKLEKKVELNEPISNLLNKLCRELSNLAKDELEDKEPGPNEIKTFVIKPLFANIDPLSPRTLTAYCPKYISEDERTKVINIISSNEHIKLLNDSTTLDEYKKDPSVLKATFKLSGEDIGEVALITATLGKITANSEVRIHKLGHRSPTDIPPNGSGGGVFRKIEPAHEESPIQRFQYIPGGIIRIFTKFPGVGEILGDNFENIESPEARVALSEIVLEAFSRHVSRQRVGTYIEEQIDPFTSEMDRLRKKATKIVYSILLKADLQELLN